MWCLNNAVIICLSKGLVIGDKILSKKVKLVGRDYLESSYCISFLFKIKTNSEISEFFDKRWSNTPKSFVQFSILTPATRPLVYPEANQHQYVVSIEWNSCSYEISCAVFSFSKFRLPRKNPDFERNTYNFFSFTLELKHCEVFHFDRHVVD